MMSCSKKRRLRSAVINSVQLYFNCNFGTPSIYNEVAIFCQTIRWTLHRCSQDTKLDKTREYLRLRKKALICGIEKRNYEMVGENLLTH